MSLGLVSRNNTLSTKILMRLYWYLSFLPIPHPSSLFPEGWEGKGRARERKSILFKKKIFFLNSSSVATELKKKKD